MKSKMVLVLLGVGLMACSGFASGTTHTKKAFSEELAAPQINEITEFYAHEAVNFAFVAPFESPAYILISASGSSVKPKVCEYWDHSAILIDYGMDLKRPPDPLITRKVGTPDSKRYYKYLFERQKIC